MLLCAHGCHARQVRRQCAEAKPAALSLLTFATITLAAAAALGFGLAAWHARVVPPLVIGALHGLLGLAGLVLLLRGLNGPPRGVAMGAGAFGTLAAIALAAAALIGLAIFATRLRRKPAPILTLAIGLHATLAIAGLALFAAWVSMPV